MPNIPRTAEREHKEVPRTIARELDYISRGTRSQYESEWIAIGINEDAEFDHGLGEIPWVISLIVSEDSTGVRPTTASTTTMTYVADQDTVTVSNFGSKVWVQVRAM